MGDIIDFIPRANLNRKAIIQEARANYERVFPTTPITDHRDVLVMDHADPCNIPSDSAYCAPDTDSA